MPERGIFLDALNKYHFEVNICNSKASFKKVLNLILDVLVGRARPNQHLINFNFTKNCKNVL